MVYWPGGDAYGNEGTLIAPERPRHCGDTGGGKPTPTTVTYVWHAGDVEVTEWNALAQITVQDGIRAEGAVLGGGGGEGGHLQGIQRLWAPPGYGKSFQ